jgi:hypothetical protein
LNQKVTSLLVFLGRLWLCVRRKKGGGVGWGGDRQIPKPKTFSIAVI